jgi:hypothetical protein
MIARLTHRRLESVFHFLISAAAAAVAAERRVKVSECSSIHFLPAAPELIKEKDTLCDVSECVYHTIKYNNNWTPSQLKRNPT